jgi:hypothetical protein
LSGGFVNLKIKKMLVWTRCVKKHKCSRTRQIPEVAIII